VDRDHADMLNMYMPLTASSNGLLLTFLL